MLGWPRDAFRSRLLICESVVSTAEGRHPEVSREVSADTPRCSICIGQ